MPSGSDYLKGLIGGVGNNLLGKVPGGKVVTGALLGGLSDADFYSFFYDGNAGPSRNPGSNLLFGARQLSEQQLKQQLGQQSNQAASSTAINPSEGKGFVDTYDWRARLRPKGGGAKRFYGDDDNSIMAPIRESGGLVWQYTPQIYVSGSAEYDQMQMQGMNYPINTYQMSTPPRFTLTSTFSVNNIDEGRYYLAMLQFFRVVTKSFYGDQSVADGTFGTPPPVMLFEYLGDHGFKKVPVIVLSYSLEFPPDVDYVPVEIKVGDENTTTFVPADSTVTCDLFPSYTPHKLRKNFNLNTLRTGQAYKDGYI
tara:strand:+ start:65 stop:994 length:930 start_codon:yes stop_codon:yes gene_type:complete